MLRCVESRSAPEEPGVAQEKRRAPRDPAALPRETQAAGTRCCPQQRWPPASSPRSPAGPNTRCRLSLALPAPGAPWCCMAEPAGSPCRPTAGRRQATGAGAARARWRLLGQVGGARGRGGAVPPGWRRGSEESAPRPARGEGRHAEGTS